MYKSDVNQELIVLMRGFFSMPVISTLGKLGVVEAMLSQQDFKLDDFSTVSNKNVLLKSFRYLSRLGLLEPKDEQKDIFRLSPLGQEVLRRHSSFYVPHSYHEYMNDFERLLNGAAMDVAREVDRLENVIGSGLTHQRYFLPAISFLRRRSEADMLVDVGCGNGHFLREALNAMVLKKVAGVDLSAISVKTTESNLKKEFSQCDITMICSDAFALEDWGRGVREKAVGHKLAVSMWFLIHEISQGDTARVIDFLKGIHRLFPEAPVVIGELVQLSEEILARERATSIMPEYLFFHELSGQGILTWDQYQRILEQIPYELSSERLFDELSDGNGGYVPSAFVWCLEPSRSKEERYG